MYLCEYPNRTIFKNQIVRHMYLRTVKSVVLQDTICVTRNSIIYSFTPLAVALSVYQLIPSQQITYPNSNLSCDMEGHAMTVVPETRKVDMCERVDHNVEVDSAS